MLRYLKLLFIFFKSKDFKESKKINLTLNHGQIFQFVVLKCEKIKLKNAN